MKPPLSHIQLEVILGLLAFVVAPVLINYATEGYTFLYYVLGPLALVFGYLTYKLVKLQAHPSNRNTNLSQKQEINEKLAAINVEIEDTNRQIANVSENYNRIIAFIYKFWLARKRKNLLKERDILHEQRDLSAGNIRVLDFAESIQELLALGGWIVEHGAINEPDADTAEFLIHRRNGFSEQNDILVHCVLEEADIVKVENLSKALENENINEGWLIADRFSGQVNSENQNREIKIIRVHDLYFNALFPVGEYIKWLRKECERMKISHYNVAIGGSISSSDIENIESNIDSVDEHVNEWLYSTGRNHISILGDFGTGKTWFCWHYAYKQLNEYLRNPRRERIPLLIKLEDYKNLAEPEMLISGFCERLGIPYKGYKLFDALNRKGLFLIILDGLDEMVDTDGESNPVETFQKLAKLAVPNSKIILTSRRTLFKSGDERRSVLDIHDSKLPAKPKTESQLLPNFEIIYFNEFDRGRIEEFIRNRFPKSWKMYWEKISGPGMNNLLELAKRPIMLEIILAVFTDDIPFEKNFTVIDLYKTYTGRWLDKVKRSDSALNGNDRRRLMQILAWKMYENRISKIHYSELATLLEDVEVQISSLRAYEESTAGIFSSEINRLFNDLTGTIAYEDEIRRQSFLVRNSSGEYFFAHKSFLEYFVAQKLCRDLNEINKESFTNHSFSHEIIDFLRYLDFDPNVLYQWTQDFRGERSHLHGNLLTLLNKKNFDLTRRDFSGIYISNADLSRANLAECNFSGATFEDVNLGESNLINTDFTNVKFCGDIILGVRSPAKGVAFSPKGNCFATSRDDNSIVFFAKSRNGWTEKKRRFGHQDSVTNIAFSNNGRLLASSSFDRLCLWKLNSEKKFISPVNEKTIYDVEFAAKDDYIFAASGETIKVWQIRETESGDVFAEEKLTATEHKKTIYKLAVSHERGEFLASASFDETIGLWEIKRLQKRIELKLKCFLEGHKSRVNGVAFSLDGRFLASSDNEGKILIWSLEDGTSKCLTDKAKETNRHRGIVWDVAFSSTGKYLASAGLDKMVKIWHVGFESEPISLEGHTANVWSVCFSPDERFVLSGSFDNTIKIWDWKNKKCLASIMMGECANKNFNCTGMKLIKAEGLSSFQRIFLAERGAIIEE